MTLVLAGLALVLTACGSSAGAGGGTGAASGSPSPAGLATFTNDRYRFALSYPAQFTRSRPKKEAEVGSGPVYDVIFADRNGARNGDAYLDAIDVSVYKLARAVTPADVAQLTPQLQDMLARSTGSLSDVKIEQPLTRANVNGVTGFSVRYTFTDAGQPLTVAAYFLFKGKYEYQISMQAASEHWNALKPGMQIAVQSFLVR